jgi:hypothetical protein
MCNGTPAVSACVAGGGVHANLGPSASYCHFASAARAFFTHDREVLMAVQVQEIDQTAAERVHWASTVVARTATERRDHDFERAKEFELEAERVAGLLDRPEAPPGESSREMPPLR